MGRFHTPDFLFPYPVSHHGDVMGSNGEGELEYGQRTWWDLPIPFPPFRDECLQVSMYLAVSLSCAYASGLIFSTLPHCLGDGMGNWEGQRPAQAHPPLSK